MTRDPVLRMAALGGWLMGLAFVTMLLVLLLVALA